MSAGKVAEFGAPEELLANADGHLSQMVDALGTTTAAKLRERAHGRAATMPAAGTVVSAAITSASQRSNALHGMLGGVVARKVTTI